MGSTYLVRSNGGCIQPLPPLINVWRNYASFRYSQLWFRAWMNYWWSISSVGNILKPICINGQSDKTPPLSFVLIQTIHYVMSVHVNWSEIIHFLGNCSEAYSIIVLFTDATTTLSFGRTWGWARDNSHLFSCKHAPSNRWQVVWWQSIAVAMPTDAVYL